MVYDSVARYVWARKGSKPCILSTGVHKATCLFGVLSLDGRQLFRQYDWVNGDNFLLFMKEAKRKFGKFLIFLDKSNPHRKNKKVVEWLKTNKNCIKVVWFPTARPELNPVEECWRQTKDAKVACRIYPSFGEMKGEIAGYVRTRRFRLDIVKYLCR